MEENSKLFYDDLVNNGYKLPDYETFKTSLQDQTKADAFYKDLSSSGFKLPDFDTFYGIFKPSEPVQEVNEPVISEPVQQERIPTNGIAEFIANINQTTLNIPADIADTWAIASAFTERQLAKLGVPGANPNIGARDVGIPGLQYSAITDDYRNIVEEVAPVSDEFKGTFAGGVSQGLGQVLGMVMTGGGSKATQIAKMTKSSGSTLDPIISAGKELLKNVGSRQGLIGGSMNASANYKQAIQEGATEEQALRYGIENMVVGSIMENLPIQSMFSRLSKVAPDAKLLDVVKDGLVGAGEEGVTEAMQTMYENMSAERIYEVNRAMLDGVGDAAAVGGTVGFLLNTMVSALTGRRARMSAPDQEVIDRAIQETEEKANTVESNNSKVEETITALENTGERTLNSGGSQLDFIENPDGSIELAEDWLSQPDAESKKLLLEKRYPNVEFQIIDNTDPNDPYAESNFTVVGRPKSNAKYSKGGESLSKNQVDLLIQGAENASDLEGLSIENDPELESSLSQKIQELTPAPEPPKISDYSGETVTVNVGGNNVSGQIAVDEGGKVTLTDPNGTIYDLDQDTPFTEFVRPVSIDQEGNFEVNGEAFPEARIVTENGVEKALLIREDGTTKAITKALVVEEIKYQIALSELNSMTDEQADQILASYEESNQQGEAETVTEEGIVESDEDRKLREATEEIDLIEELALQELEDVESKAKLVKYKPETMKEEKVYLVKKNEDGTYTATLNGRKVARPEINQKLGELYEGETNTQIEDLQRQTDQLKADVEQKLFGRPKSEPKPEASKKPTGEKQSTPKDVQQKPVDKTDDTKIQVDETTKQKETSKGDGKKSTPKKTSGTTKRIQKIAKDKKQFFQDIKKKFGFNANATSATVAKRYDAVKSMDKPSKEDLAFIEAVDKAEKTEYVKPSMKGKTPKSKRALSENQSKAMDVEVGTNYYDIAIQALIGKKGGLLYNSIAKEAFGGNPLQEMRSRVGLTKADGMTIEEFVEDMKANSDIDIDETKMRSAVIQVVKDHSTTEEMANTLLEKHKSDKSLISEELPQEEVLARREMSFNDAVAENYTSEEWNDLSTGDKLDYLNEFYQYEEGFGWDEQHLEMAESGVDFSDDQLSEATSFLDSMTDEEIQEYADGYEEIEGEFAPESKIEASKRKIQELKDSLRDQINQDNQGIIVDFEAKAKADIKFYNTLKNLIVEYARLKGLQFNEFIADLQKLLGQEIDEKSQRYLKTLWNRENQRKTSTQKKIEKAVKSAPERKKDLLVDSYQELKKSLREQAKAARGGAKSEQQRVKELRGYLAQYIKDNAREINTLGTRLSTTILNKVNAINSEIGLNNALNYIDNVLANQDFRNQITEKNSLIEQIRSEVDTRKQVKNESGVVKSKGKQTADGISVLGKIQEALKMSRIEAESRMEEIMQKLYEGDPNDTLSPDETFDLEAELYALNFAGLETLSNEQIKSMLDELKQIKKTDRINALADKQAFRDKISSNIEETIKVLNPEGKDVKPQYLAKKSDFRKDSKLRAFFLSNDHWASILDKLSRLDKASKAMSSFLNKKFDRELMRKSINNEQKSRRKTLVEFQNKYEEIFGKKGKKKAAKDNTIPELFTYTDINGNKVELEMSQNEIYKRWMELQDETLLPTFEKMGMGQDYMDAIENAMSPEIRQWAEWQLNEFYPKYAKSINEVYRRVFGVDMPIRDNYSPISRIQSRATDNTSDTFDKGGIMATVNNGSLKARVGSRLPLKNLDGDRALIQYVYDMEFFKAHSESLKELRSSLLNEEVSNTINQLHGKEYMDAIRAHIDSFFQKPKDRNIAERLLNSFRNTFTVHTLALNPVVYIKQLTSIPAYANSIPVAQWVKGEAMFWSNPLKNAKELYENSTYLQNRYERGFDRDMIMAMQKDHKTAVTGSDNLASKMMVLTKYGDMHAILSGGWPVYDYHKKKAIKEGMSQKDAVTYAISKFEDSTEFAQQASDVNNLSIFQKGSEFYKVMTMYKTSPMAYHAMAMSGLRNLIQGRGNASDNIKQFAMFHIMLPVIFQWASMGFRWPDDKDEQYELIRAGILGNINSIFIAGDLIDYIIKVGIEGKPFDYTVNNLLQGLFKNSVKSIEKIDKLIGEITFENMIQAIDQVAKTASAFNPEISWYNQVSRSIEGMIDVAEGETEYPVKRALGWSDWALGENEYANKQKNKILEKLFGKNYKEEKNEEGETYYDISTKDAESANRKFGER